jgi:hypothetical protein
MVLPEGRKEGHMKNSITFEKNNHTFKLNDFRYIPGKGFLGMTCQIDRGEGISAEYWEHKNAIMFNSVAQIGREKVKGIGLPNSFIGKQMKDMLAQLKEEHINKKAAEKAKEDAELDRLAEQVISGKKRLVVSAAGCLDVYYVCSIEGESREKSQKILGKAIEKATGYKAMSPDKYLGQKARNKNLQFEESVSFMDLMNDAIQKKEDEKKHINDCIAKAKSSGEKVIIKKDYDECNDPATSCNIDEIITYAMPDGSVQTERIHTY